jgi:O-methyltransferase
MTNLSEPNRREVEYSSTHRAEIEDHPIADIDRNAEFSDLFARTRNYTMTSKEIMFSTYQAARYVAERGIPGDIVECGVWRGGSALLAGLAVRAAEARKPHRGLLAARRRKLWLYDTFEGMTTPTAQDVDLTGTAAALYMAEHSDEGRWCYADEADVRRVFASEGFSPLDIEIVKGDVVQTLPKRRPNRIALLRLDTDWYESTKAELELLYPRLSRGGVLIIDDYGHWEGSRQAVDEFFAREPGLLLNRIGYAVRVAVKS